MTSNNIYPQITPYVYKITHKETGKFYIGSRLQNVNLNLLPEEDFGIIYFTSGKFEEEFKQNVDLFEAQIIYRFNEYDVCYWYEQLIIRENIKNERCINSHYIDPDTSISIFSMFGRKNPHTIETRNKISNSSKGKKHSKESKAKISAASKIFRHSNESKAKISIAMTGFKHSNETKEKLSLANKGKKMSEETKAKISSTLKLKLANKGRKHSDETKAKISATRKLKFSQN